MKNATFVASDYSGPLPSKCIRRPIDPELWKLASLHAAHVTTAKHAKLVLRVNGFAASKEAVAALQSRMKAVLRARFYRLRDRIAKRTGKPVDYRPAPDQPFLPPAQRLIQTREALAVASAKRCLRHGAAGGSTFQVSVAPALDAVGYRILEGWNWDTYGGKFKGWRALEDHHRIAIPHDWLSRVYKRGLACAGGMFTLSVLPLVPAGDIELFQAKWVEQGRGYSVKVRDGFIAHCGDVVYHADTADKAVAGVRRALTAAGRGGASRHSPYRITVDEFIQHYAKHGAVDVSLDDAYAAGCCEYGVRSWCQLVGIDYEAGRVPLSRVLEGFRVAPLIEVRRTVVRTLANRRRRAQA